MNSLDSIYPFAFIHPVDPANHDEKKFILKVTDLHFGYPSQGLFSHFSASLPPGVTLIRGGSGRGKSTLLQLLAGALQAESGQLQVCGIDLFAQPDKFKAKVFLTEPRSTAFDTLSLPDYFEVQRRKYDSFDDGVLNAMTDCMGLQQHLNKQLFMLSTGSKRKVFLAAAFASGAAVTLLDEPFAALDAESTRSLAYELKRFETHNTRACVLADYLAPVDLLLAQTIDLGE